MTVLLLRRPVSATGIVASAHNGLSDVINLRPFQSYACILQVPANAGPEPEGIGRVAKSPT